MTVIPARSKHFIANTQAQPVRLVRVAPVSVLLPRRHVEVIEQGQNWTFVLPTLAFATLGTATATGGVLTMTADPTIASAIAGSATATGLLHLANDGAAVHALGTTTVGTATATGMAATGDVLSEYFVSQESDDGSSLTVGATAAPRRAQSFEVPDGETLNVVELKLLKSGSPADNVTVEIHSNATDRPSGTVLETTSAVSGASLSGTAAWYTFTLDTPLAISADTQYWVVVGRSGAADDTNFYRWSRILSDVDSTILHSSFTTSWSAGSNALYDLTFRLQ
jgi:hypothetical protein